MNTVIVKSKTKHSESAYLEKFELQDMVSDYLFVFDTVQSVMMCSDKGQGEFVDYLTVMSTNEVKENHYFC